MLTKPIRRSLVAAAALAAACVTVSPAAIAKHGKAQAGKAAAPQAVVSVFADGLNNPRGLRFGPDGYLYVAEGGVGGVNPPPADPACVVIPPVGPYLGSPTGSRISRIDAGGHRTTFVDGLPSSQTSPALGNLVSGVADVAFVGDTLYALLSGAGCSHGVPQVPNGIIRVNPDATWTLVADLGAWVRANPVAHPEEDDFEPDGSWYGLLAVRGDLYAVEPNHGEILKVTTSGQISRLIDVSATQGHAVPASIAFHGNFYVGNLGTFPQDAGSSKVWKITPSGQIKVDSTGYNMVLGLAFDGRDRMYVLEASAAPAPAPGTGRVLRISPDGKTRQVIADGLFLPTGMTFGPDGALYVSNVGFGPPPVGLGQVLKIQILD
jgi:hypothetical protein